MPVTKEEREGRDDRRIEIGLYPGLDIEIGSAEFLPVGQKRQADEYKYDS